MQNTQRQFFDLAIQAEVLRFGEFTLKSGRISPYFFNAGLFNTGSSLSQLGSLYADAIKASGLDFDMLYGPAYKGIPLAAAIAIAMYQNHGLDLPYAFNRKEAKDHGEGGVIVGAPVHGKVLIVDDVISAGTSVRESIEIINQNGGTPVGVGIALDRQERGQGEKSAVQEVQDDHQLQVISIAGIADLIDYLNEKGDEAENLQRIKAYRSEYGVGI